MVATYAEAAAYRLTQDPPDVEDYIAAAVEAVPTSELRRELERAWVLELRLSRAVEQIARLDGCEQTEKLMDGPAIAKQALAMQRRLTRVPSGCQGGDS